MIKDILELPEIKNLPSKRFEYGSFVGKVLYLGWYQPLVQLAEHYKWKG